MILDLLAFLLRGGLFVLALFLGHKAWTNLATYNTTNKTRLKALGWSALFALDTIMLGSIG